MAEQQNQSHIVAGRTIHRLLGIVCLTFAFLPWTPCPATADPISEGLAAYDRGDYATAYKLCLP
jgi:hypothetical protein